jgi:hypothetical protein
MPGVPCSTCPADARRLPHRPGGRPPRSFVPRDRAQLGRLRRLGSAAARVRRLSSPLPPVRTPRGDDGYVDDATEPGSRGAWFDAMRRPRPESRRGAARPRRGVARVAGGRALPRPREGSRHAASRRASRGAARDRRAGARGPATAASCSASAPPGSTRSATCSSRGSSSTSSSCAPARSRRYRTTPRAEMRSARREHTGTEVVVATVEPSADQVH